MFFCYSRNLQNGSRNFGSFYGVFFGSVEPLPRSPCPMLRRTRHPHRGRNNGVIPMPVDVEPSTRVELYRGSACVYTVIAAPPLIPSSFARLKMSVKIFYLFSYHGEKNEKKFFASYDFFCIFASLVKGVSLS